MPRNTAQPPSASTNGIQQYVKLEKRLVLLAWLNSLFGYKNNRDLLADTKAVAEELRRGALAEQSQAQQALSEARQKVLDALGDKALDANGDFFIHKDLRGFLARELDFYLMRATFGERG